MASDGGVDRGGVEEMTKNQLKELVGKLQQQLVATQDGYEELTLERGPLVKERDKLLRELDSLLGEQKRCEARREDAGDPETILRENNVMLKRMLEAQKLSIIDRTGSTLTEGRNKVAGGIYGDGHGGYKNCDGAKCDPDGNLLNGGDVK